MDSSIALTVVTSAEAERSPVSRTSRPERPPMGTSQVPLNATQPLCCSSTMPLHLLIPRSRIVPSRLQIASLLTDFYCSHRLSRRFPLPSVRRLPNCLAPSLAPRVCDIPPASPTASVFVVPPIPEASPHHTPSLPPTFLALPSSLASSFFTTAHSLVSPSACRIFGFFAIDIAGSRPRCLLASGLRRRTSSSTRKVDASCSVIVGGR